ncbi:MAG: hypothetical protein U0795_00445 [Pirellulales bacterium]
MSDDAKSVLHQAASDPAKLTAWLDQQSSGWGSLSREAQDQLVALVPQLAQLLDGELTESNYQLHAEICDLLSRMGPRGSEAVAALFRHAERYPRFELNVLAIGRIGGQGVVRRLIEWTYWQGGRHDRKRTDAVTSAIGILGEEAIRQLLEIANSEVEDSHTRAAALLNLADDTAYPRLELIPRMVQEMDRSEMVQCIKVLGDRLIELGQEYPEKVVTEISPRLLANSRAASEFIRILSQLGDSAVSTLSQSVIRKVEVIEAISALAGMGDAGLEGLYELLATSDDYVALLTAIDVIPTSGERSLTALADVIQRVSGEDGWGDAVRQTALARLDRFTDQRVQVEQLLRRWRED